MKVEIKTQDARGGTEFIAVPSRLHLGGQHAEGVDKLEFVLPAEWDGKSVSLHIRHNDGKDMVPVLLSAEGTVSVGRFATEVTDGLWMLAATDGAGYNAYTKPGTYDTYQILSTSGDGTEIPESQYEQFVNQVLESASNAMNAAAQAQAAQAQAAKDAETAATQADKAEAAANRAEAVAPEGGAVISVNGQGGVVTLDASDVGATPAPENPVAGQVLYVKSIGEKGITVGTTNAPTGGGDGGSGTTNAGGFVEIDTNIPAEERVKGAMYWLNLADLSSNPTLTSDALKENDP